MARRDHDIRFSSPAVERARARAEERARALHGGATGRVVGDRVDLAVLVDEIAACPIELKETLPRAWVKELLDDHQEIHWGADGEAVVDLMLSIESAFVRMKGTARFRLMHPCVRCGQRDVSFDLPLKIDLRLVERAKDNEIEGDFEAHSDGDDHEGPMLGDAADLEDIDIASYQGDTVDVGAVLREQLFLELPAHPNCESPGSTLGERCAFGEQQRRLEQERASWIDPRWGALMGLKAALPRGPASDAPAPVQTPKPAQTPKLVQTPKPAQTPTAVPPPQAPPPRAPPAESSPQPTPPASTSLAPESVTTASPVPARFFPAAPASAKPAAKKPAAKKPAAK